MSLPKNLCFFSARCRFSQNFLEELAKSPYSKEFRFISVDVQPGGARPSLPPYVKAVPTLMIDGEAKPRTDSDVMNWLSERRLRSAPSGSGSGGSGSGSGSGSVAASGGGGDGLMAFGDEMAINGDEFYSFIGEDATATKGSMVRMVGTMASINDLTGLGTSNDRARGEAAAAAGSSIGTPRQTEKAKALDDALMAYQQMRDRDMRPTGPNTLGPGSSGPGSGPGSGASSGFGSGSAYRR
jgi:hypothetical protein